MAVRSLDDLLFRIAANNAAVRHAAVTGADIHDAISREDSQTQGKRGDADALSGSEFDSEKSAPTGSDGVGISEGDAPSDHGGQNA